MCFISYYFNGKRFPVSTEHANVTPATWQASRQQLKCAVMIGQSVKRKACGNINEVHAAKHVILYIIQQRLHSFFYLIPFLVPRFSMYLSIFPMGIEGPLPSNAIPAENRRPTSVPATSPDLATTDITEHRSTWLPFVELGEI